MATSEVENFTFDNCTFSVNSAVGFGGGAIRSASASYTIKNCSFNSNYAPNGGAIFSNGDGQEIIGMNNTFTGNTADFGGSQASYGTYASYTFTNNTYSQNAVNTSGGALINGFGADVTIDNCNFMSNIARFGGAIFNQNDTTNVEIYNSNFMENTAGDGNGGAINITAPITLTIDRCLFQSNSAGFGGAINGNEGIVDVIEGFLHLSNSTFILNTASIQGAAISLVDLDLQMSNTVIGTNLNTGSGAGGGLSLNSTANKSMNASIINSTIADNFAFTGSGISAFTESTNSNCIINIQNTILSNEGPNYEIEAGTPVISSFGGNISSDATLEDIFINTNDQNNVVDMKFVNNNNYNYDIEDDSPAINNGIEEGAPETDILGNPRVGAPDAGAFENQDPLGIEIIQNQGQLTLMPNPAFDHTNLSLTNDWKGDIKISILNASGKMYMHSVLKKTSQDFLQNLDLNALNPGTYILIVQSENRKISTPFIKI
jgi:predicted outer membrane repeat protein